MEEFIINNIKELCILLGITGCIFGAYMLAKIMDMQQIKIITEKDFTSFEEDWGPVFRCPKCHWESLRKHDNYCCKCGQKIKWDETALKISD
jgi:hypothetical protein